MKFTNPVQPNDSNSFGISYSALSYFRDYEYFKNKIQTGSTAFGTWHYPRLYIQPSKNLRIEAGAFIRKDFGEKDPTPTRAMFSVQFKPQKNTTLIFGAIEGSLSHNLIQPLMQYDRIMDRPIEEGFQVKFKNERIWADAWIDWELRQTVNSNYPEELTGGLSFEYSITKPGKPWQLKLPLQFITPHKGGQLDTNSSAVITVLNTAAGLKAEWQNPRVEKFLQHFSMEAFYVGYSLDHANSFYPFDKGNGFLLNLLLKSKPGLGFNASYWNGKRFIAPKGNPILQSISSMPRFLTYTERERQLLVLNLFYEKEFVPGFFVYGSLNPYVNLNDRYMEHSFMILLRYQNNFRIGRLKK